VASLGSRAIQAGSGLGVATEWHAALETALDDALAPFDGGPADLLVLFVSAAFSNAYADLLAEARSLSGAQHIVGCSASAVIAGERELEDEPGVAALVARFPAGAQVSVQYVGPHDVEHPGIAVSDCHGLIVLADPFTTDITALVSALERDCPGAPVMGGLATADPRSRGTFVFCGDRVAREGAVVVTLGGGIGLRPLVSQGCEPIGQPWTITDAERNIVKSIGGRPAYQVLAETVGGLDSDQRERVNGNLLVGLAMDEYRDEFKRGDFLIRNLMGVDPASGMIAIGAEAGVGQTIQFQIRDAHAADAELRSMLDAAHASGAAPVAALLFACNGRGIGLFGGPDHDAKTIREVLGPLPLAGLFCNGEIGPVGARTFVHGFTASLALIAPLD
jgi:small ligand-binding sensory domain FIST